VPSGSRSSYLPATLVTGFPPMAVLGIDLSDATGLPAALSRATRANGVVATPIASPRTGDRGLFLVAPAPNRIGNALRAGYVALFVSARGLHAVATGEPAVQVRAGGGSAQAGDRGETSSESFTAAGQRFTVVVPRGSVEGAAAVLPWFILAGGLVVVALGGALALNATRRARAQEELDRVFSTSQDLIAVADFEGRFTRVNPAATPRKSSSRVHISTSSIRPTGTARRRRHRPSRRASRRCRSRTATCARTDRSGCSIGR
jgi:PAS domain-containing protein